MMNNTSAFDHEALSSLREILEDGLDELLEDFVELIPPMIDDLILAAQASDNKQLASISHSLKGSSGNLAIHEFSKLCMEIETMANNGQIDDVIPVISNLQKEFSRASSEIGCMLEK